MTFVYPRGATGQRTTIMRKITDMGDVKGEHVFHVSGNPTWGDLIREGIIIAIPDSAEGIIYKRREKCTPVEIMAALTVEEAAAITAAWNAAMDAGEQSCQ